MQWRRPELNRLPTDLIFKRRVRKELALLVANAGRRETVVMNCILEQEVLYIQSDKLPAAKQGCHVKSGSWLSDEGTLLAI